MITLIDFLPNLQGTSGAWTIIEGTPDPGAFNAAAGTFNNDGHSEACLVFRYTYNGINCSGTADLKLNIIAAAAAGSNTNVTFTHPTDSNDIINLLDAVNGEQGGTWTLTQAPSSSKTYNFNITQTSGGATIAAPLVVGQNLPGPTPIIVWEQSNLDAGTYIFEYEVANDCDTSNATVTVDLIDFSSTVDVEITEDALGAGFTGQPEASLSVTSINCSGSITYLWNTGATTSSITTNTGGEFEVTVTCSNGLSHMVESCVEQFAFKEATAVTADPFNTNRAFTTITIKTLGVSSLATFTGIVANPTTSTAVGIDQISSPDVNTITARATIGRGENKVRFNVTSDCGNLLTFLYTVNY